jgi:hypothetical protein
MAQAVIINDNKAKTKTIKAFSYPITKIVKPKRISLIEEVLPFRIKFTTIGVEAYGSNNVPGIGIQVIGYSNYIL